MRLMEELGLLEEEKRRILQFLTWHAGWWDEQMTNRPCEPTNEVERQPGAVYLPSGEAYREGIVAYANRQAARLRKLADLFEDQWVDMDEFISMGRAVMGVLPEEEEYLAALPEEERWGDVHKEDEQPVPPRPPPPLRILAEPVAEAIENQEEEPY
jgi:hypothetical protein